MSNENPRWKHSVNPMVLQTPKTCWSFGIFLLKQLRQASWLHLSCDRPEELGTYVLTEPDPGSREGISPPKIPAPPSQHVPAAFNWGRAPVTREVPAGGSAFCRLTRPAKDLSRPWQKLTNTRSSWSGISKLLGPLWKRRPVPFFTTKASGTYLCGRVWVWVPREPDHPSQPLQRSARPLGFGI